MSTDHVLITCPPMLKMIDELRPLLDQTGWQTHCPEVVQTLSEDELVKLVPDFDGWIIGDDPASRRVFEAGKQGRLRAAVKFGVGVDNVDFEAARDLGLPVTNTPGVFGREVADIAMSYVAALARETFVVDRAVRQGGWPKPRGISLANKVVGLVGFGDIGRSFARRALAAEMRIVAYDPKFTAHPGIDVEPSTWPERVETCDFIVLCCALTAENRHMINRALLDRCKPGLRVVNVARGPLIDTAALVDALASAQVHSAALDVLEDEPLPTSSPLLRFERCIFGSHNASNTYEAVTGTSERAVKILQDFLQKQ